MDLAVQAGPLRHGQMRWHRGPLPELGLQAWLQRQRRRGGRRDAREAGGSKQTLLEDCRRAGPILLT